MSHVPLMETVAWKLFLGHDTIAFVFEGHTSPGWIDILEMHSVQPSSRLECITRADCRGQWHTSLVCTPLCVCMMQVCFKDAICSD